VNLKTGRAVRVIAKEDARDKAKEYFPEIEDKYKAQLEAYKIMSDNDLFGIMDVKVDIKPEDMPGRPLRRIRCDSCGEYVQDMRDVLKDGRILCKPCAYGGYYTIEDKSYGK
jgi:formylmethanofuran dehydrogenase subunit E